MALARMRSRDRESALSWRLAFALSAPQPCHHAAALADLAARRQGFERIEQVHHGPDQFPGSAAWEPGLAPVDGTILDELMPGFSMTMTNTLQFSSCEAPWKPISEPRQETLAVELRADFLTLTQKRANGSLGRRIYAQRTVDLAGATAYMIIPQLPSRLRDDAFFSALGTVVLFDRADGERRRLRAVGTDINSGRCRGWIFDAQEA